MKRLYSFLATLLAGLLLNFTLAQPLAEFAPADAFLALGFERQSPVLASLKDDLLALDWAQAGQTLEAILSEADLDAEFADLSELFDLFEGKDALLEELRDGCPNLAEIIEQEDLKIIGDEALVTISVNAFNPIPAFSAITRFSSVEAAETAARLQDALIDCAEQDGDLVQLEQDGVPLYVLGNGGDLPVVMGRLDNLFFFGTNPEPLRGIIRLANSSTESSLADTDFYKRANNSLAPGGFSLSLNFAALVPVLENTAGMFLSDPETEVLFERLLALLRTLNGYVGKISTNSEGLLLESVLTLNPSGDPQLAELLLCQSCTVSYPFIAPASATSVNSQYLSLRKLFDYLQGWLNEAEAVSGENLDIKARLKEEFDFDLDKALFDWIGAEWQYVVLEPSSRDLETLFYGPGQVLFVPVRSQELAKAGLEEWGRLLKPLTAELNNFAMPGRMGMLEANMGSMIATRSYDYRDNTITRYQLGLNTDIGLSFIGNFLVIGTPADALEPLIDTFAGERNILSNPDYRQLLANSPDSVMSLNYSNDRAALAGLADLLELASQPAAFGLSALLAEAETKNAPDYAELLQLTEILPQALKVIAKHLSFSEGYSTLVDDSIYQRSLTRIVW